MDANISEVLSRCRSCGETVPALILERDGQVFQRSLCPGHPGAEELIFSHVGLYRKLERWNDLLFPSSRQAVETREVASECECNAVNSQAPSLAVIDLTNSCNFQCPLCFAEITRGQRHYYLDQSAVRRMLDALLHKFEAPCRPH